MKISPETRELLFILLAIALVVGCYILGAYIDTISTVTYKLT